jgi:hypothetical protein
VTRSPFYFLGGKVETLAEVTISYMREFNALRAEHERVTAELQAARDEIAIDGALLAERQRILDACPCPVHGACVPHVLDRLEKLEAAEAELSALRAQLAEKDAGHRVELEGACERTKIVLKHKDDWMARALKAEAAFDALNTEYVTAYEKGLNDQSGSGVLQAVLDAIAGTLDPSTQIADHPNVKYALIQVDKLRVQLAEKDAETRRLKAQLQRISDQYQADLL